MFVFSIVQLAIAGTASTTKRGITKRRVSHMTPDYDGFEISHINDFCLRVCLK